MKTIRILNGLEKILSYIFFELFQSHHAILSLKTQWLFLKSCPGQFLHHCHQTKTSAILLSSVSSSSLLLIYPWW